MFLITSDFSVRVDRVIKIVPADKKGTYVYIDNHTRHTVDKEYTTMPYADVLKQLDVALM